MSAAHSSAQIARYVMVTVVLLGFGALFAITISSKLEQPKATQQAQQSPSPPDAGSGSLEGRPAPVFELVNLQGQPVKLEDFRGKIVFLNFWATWCEPCKKEMPSMERLYKRMKGRPFEILAISLDKEPVKDVKKFVAHTKISFSFPVLAETPDQKVSKLLYKTTGVPESFIIGADGKVVKHAIGSYEWDSPQIVEYIDNLVKSVKSTAAAAAEPRKG